MHDKRVKVRNLLDSSTESKWVRTQYESGIPLEDIVTNVEREIGKIGPDQASTRLAVEYILGKKGFDDIQHFLTPHVPNNLTFVGAYSEGYLYQASGVTDGARFQVLLAIPQIDEQRVKSMVSAHHQEVCFLAYKRAHEGSPAEYAPGEVATSKVHMELLSPLLED